MVHPGKCAAWRKAQKGAFGSGPGLPAERITRGKAQDLGVLGAQASRAVSASIAESYYLQTSSHSDIKQGQQYLGGYV